MKWGHKREVSYPLKNSFLEDSILPLLIQNFETMYVVDARSNTNFASNRHS